MPLPLDLYLEVLTSSGARYRWDANQAPGSRPRNLGFRTKLGEGFSDATMQLARRIDFDYPDLDLVNSVVLVGADGAVAYEGRVSAMPRELGDTHSIGVTLTGWMAHAKDRKFAESYVDRDLNAWQDMSRSRRAVTLGANNMPTASQQQPDVGASQAGVSTLIEGSWATPFVPRSEAWYDAGPEIAVGKIAYSWKRMSALVDPANTNWSWVALVSDDDSATTTLNTGELRASGPSSGVFTPSTQTRRYAALAFTYTATAAGADGARYEIAWYDLAVYGAHNLSTYAGEPGEPEGVLASDVIKDIAGRWCPMLNTAGVQPTSYVIQHLTFKDRVYPYDAFLELNKFHLWHLGVWEDRTLHFRPYDLTDYDWEIRTDDQGTSFSPQGPSVDDLFNGIVVKYTDILTGTVNVLRPDVFTDLADLGAANPWNEWGIQHWDEVELSTPTIQAQALQIGRAVLLDRIRPKAPGTITVRGHIRDRRGNPQPAWKVRAGDTISVTNFPNDAPRLIVETDYDDESKEVRLALDKPFQLVEAYMDRAASALSARGLSSS